MEMLGGSSAVGEVKIRTVILLCTNNIKGNIRALKKPMR
jgi:hypothetical protein